MPELPEVEVLVRSLRPLILGRTIRTVAVRRPKVVLPASPQAFASTLLGARFVGLERRGKYLLFQLQRRRRVKPITLVGHLGMTGRMYLAPCNRPAPKHTPVILGLGRENFIFEDTRYFGRMTLDSSAVSGLGPEPLGPDFTVEYLRENLKRSTQPIKVKLLDQSLVAGVGNIYASEALFGAGISPRRVSRRLGENEVAALWSTIREVLAEAIEFGSTVPLNFSGEGERDGLFYFGGSAKARGSYQERLRVYDRANEPCPGCGELIKRLVQAGRSTYYCPRCQKSQNRSAV